MADSTDYVCGLDPVTLAKAKKELNEDPNERLGAVQTLREWLSQQKHMTCNTETTWLLRILRASKFSQLKSRELITKYLSMKKVIPSWLEEYDFTNHKVQLFYKTGACVLLPGRLPDGCRVLFINMGALDPGSKEYDVYTMGAVTFGLLSHILSDENVQVSGIRIIGDTSGFTLAHQNFLTLDKSKKFFQLIHGTFPIRLKGIHMYNHGALIEAFLSVLKQFMTKKGRERITLHGNSLESIYKIFPKSILPAEYVPDGEEDQSAGTIQSIIESQLKELTSVSVRETLLRESSKDFQIDRSAIPNDEPQASFRKLNTE